MTSKRSRNTFRPIDKHKLLECVYGNQANQPGRLLAIPTNGFTDAIRMAIAANGLAGELADDLLVEEIVKAYYTAVVCEWNFLEALGCVFEEFADQIADDNRRHFEEGGIAIKLDSLYNDLTKLELNIVNALGIAYEAFNASDVCHVGVYRDLPHEILIRLDYKG